MKDKQNRNLVLIISGCLIMSLFVVWFVWALMLARTRHTMSLQSRASYLITGGRTGCSDEELVNSSELFLKQEFEKEVKCCISKKELLKMAVDGRGWAQEIGKDRYINSYYNNGVDDYDEWAKKCSMYENKVINSINNLK